MIDYLYAYIYVCVCVFIVTIPVSCALDPRRGPNHPSSRKTN